MHYAGPREAMHHINLREMVGFNRFTVGRDHAGAQNNYRPLDAYKIVTKNIKNFEIDIFFCTKGHIFVNHVIKLCLNPIVVIKTFRDIRKRI